VSTVVRQRRRNGLYVVVLVEEYRYGPLLQAARLDVP
jgi:hypothetical protein